MAALTMAAHCTMTALTMAVLLMAALCYGGAALWPAYDGGPAYDGAAL
jgi:hypothetical protein